jgi:hypothetical protein
MENSIKKIPMSTDEIQELFLNPENKYIVDLENSKLKGEAFITYIANMKMKCDLLVDPNLSKLSKFEILKIFLNFNYFVDCQTLINTSCMVMLRSRGFDLNTSDSWMSLEEIDEFISLNTDMVSTISDFLDSMLIAVPSLNIFFKKEFLEPSIESGEVICIEDPNIISVNVFGMLTVPDFLEIFLASKKDFNKFNYYKYQIERFSYNKKTFFDLFLDLNSDSILLSLCNTFFSEEKEEIEILNKYSFSTAGE